MLFSRKDKKKDIPSAGLLARLDGKSLKYVSVRRGEDYTESVVGKVGALNIRDGRVVISCDTGVVLNRSIAELTIGELLSNDGATFQYRDEQNIPVTMIAYYTYYRKS